MTVNEIVESCRTVHNAFTSRGIDPVLVVVEIASGPFDMMRASPILMKHAKTGYGFALDPKTKKAYFDIEGIRFLRG